MKLRFCFSLGPLLVFHDSQRAFFYSPLRTQFCHPEFCSGSVLVMFIPQALLCLSSCPDSYRDSESLFITICHSEFISKSLLLTICHSVGISFCHPLTLSFRIHFGISVCCYLSFRRNLFLSSINFVIPNLFRNLIHHTIYIIHYTIPISPFGGQGA